MNSKSSLTRGSSEVGGVDKTESNAGVRLTDEQAAPPSSSHYDLAMLIAGNLENRGLIKPRVEVIRAVGVIAETLRTWKW